MEKEIFFIGTRTFKSEKKGQTYYLIDYVDLDGYIPYSDYISALEFTEINKKMKDKHFVNVTAILSVNQYKRVYVSGIK